MASSVLPRLPDRARLQRKGPADSAVELINELRFLTRVRRAHPCIETADALFELSRVLQRSLGLLLIVGFQQDARDALKHLRLVHVLFERLLAPEQDAAFVVGFHGGLDERVRSMSSCCGEFGILRQMLFQRAGELKRTIAGLAQRSAEFLLFGFGQLQPDRSTRRPTAGNPDVTCSFCSLWFGIAESVRQRGGPFPSHVQITVVLGDTIEKRQKPVDADQALPIVCRLDLKKRLVHAEAVKFGGALEIEMEPLRFGDALEPVLQQLRVFIERVVELCFVFRGSVFETKGLHAHVGDLQVRFERPLEVIQLVDQIEDLARIFGRQL